MKSGCLFTVYRYFCDDKRMYLVYDAISKIYYRDVYQKMILKGEMSMLNVLHLDELDVDKILTELKMKKDGSPQFFMRIPIVVDCAELDFDTDDISLLDFATLKTGLLELGFIPVGVRNTPKLVRETLLESGWAVMPASMTSKKAVQDEEKEQTDNVISTELPENAEKTEEASEKTGDQPPEHISSLVIERPVRSGQQIYASGSDLTILSATSAGSEIMADGSIHVYGALRGRVLAGVKGNKSARIFCQSLQAELIVIAGRYQLLDESDTKLIGKPAKIHLKGEKLIIEPLS